MVDNTELRNSSVVCIEVVDLWERAYMLLLKHNFAEDGLDLLPGGMQWVVRHVYRAYGVILHWCFGRVSAGVNEGCAGDCFFKDGL